ncbi:Kruppel-like factor 18 [Peromyscus californicus insignis]|uniref:Kruppel-like factor 18 n=1 Tax=Peromyscus californicus insignis TaxID=564181 RepID=UPI0022A73FEA|nr:Kruppel-like factor 18 [Peromyscus californicus insignis]
MDFQFGEPSETTSLYQQVASADQNKSPADSQLMDLNTQETSLSDSQARAFPDSKEIVYKEGSEVTTLRGNESLVSHSAALCGRQRISPGENQDSSSGGQLESLEGGHVRSFSCDQTCDEDHLIPSVFDQTIKGKYQEIPVIGDQTFACSQVATRMGEQFPSEGQMTAPIYSLAPHPSRLITPSSAHSLCGDKKMILSRDMTLFQDHLVAIKGYQAFYSHPMRDPISAQINHYGQLVSLHGQNVPTVQGTVPRVKEGLHPQVISFSGGDSSLHSGVPLASRQPPESVSVSASVQGELPQDNSYFKTKNHDSQKKTHNVKPYFCAYGYCEQSFSKPSLLRNHMRTHTEEMPYACNYPRFNWEFTDLDILIRHRRQRTGVDPYLCMYCNRSFTRLDNLKKHWRSHF